MKIIFFGTPDYVLPILEKLYKYHEVIAVVTQSPKKSGRGQKLTYSPVDNFTHKRKIPIFFDFVNLPNADLGVCAAYGQIVPPYVISHMSYGILNVHPSLLPKYRGASPVQAAIANGDIQTGVTIIKMDEKVDHGPIVTQFKEEILPNDTTETLRARLFERSAQVLIDLIPNYSKGKINPKSQDHEKATYTKVLKKEDGFIDLTVHCSLITVHNFIRAMYPWPCAWTRLSDGKRLKLLPNDMVQLEGKNPVSKRQFKLTYPSSVF